MTGIIINPGTGPVEGASEDEARANVSRLMLDVGLRPCAFAVTGPPNRGRYPFEISHNGRICEVDMPGLPIERVRYTGADDQNIWDFPRLYVDGSSWIWCYAVGMVHESLAGEADE